MSAPIGPGSWVECVDPRGDDHLAPRGSIWRVEALADYYGTPCLILEKLVHPSGERKVWASSFRPIWRGDKSLIETLLQPLSEHVGERV